MYDVLAFICFNPFEFPGRSFFYQGVFSYVNSFIQIIESEILSFTLL